VFPLLMAVAGGTADRKKDSLMLRGGEDGQGALTS
jgi:hypothetical protein